MKKIWQKSLACMVSAALCLTAFVGCLTVNAATTYNGKITSDGVAVETTATEATVKLTISAEVDMAAAGITVSTDFGALTNVSVPTENEVRYKIDPPADGGFNLANGTVIVEAKDQKDYPFNNAEVTLTFTKNKELTLNENDSFAVNVTPLKNSTIPAATYNEDEIYFTVDVINITVKASTPVCEHDWGNGVVTLRPTTVDTGIREFTCSKCEEVKEETIPVATIVTTTAEDPQTNKVGHNIALQNSIEVSFNIRNAYIADVVDYYAVFTKEYYDIHGEVIGTDTITKEKEDFVYYNSSQKAVRYNKLAAKEMGTKVTAEIYAELADGTFKCIVDEYRISKYIDTAIAAYSGSDTAKAKAMMRLVIDLANYGAASQNNFNYNTDNLVNTAYADYQSYASSEVPTLSTVSKSISNENAYIKLSRQLNLESSICISASIQNLDNSAYTGDMSNFKAKCIYTNQSGEEQEPLWIDSSEFVYLESNGKYAVNFDKYTTLQSSHKVSITLYSGDTIISNTVEYSIMSYAYSVANAYDTSNPLRILTDNMMKFCKAAEDYFS